MTDAASRTSPKIGFIGLGAMGSRMAARLLDAGYALSVYNRTMERAGPLTQRGAIMMRTPGLLAGASDVVLSCLTDDHALEGVMSGSDGVLASARPGTIVVEMSTVLPRTSRLLFEEARAKGVSFLDAPVSGSTPQAEQGQLVIFVGGSEEAYTTCRPLFGVLGKEAIYMGASGSGTATKLCVNALLGVGVQALAEALALGRKAGLEYERFLRALGETAVLSPAQKSKLVNAGSDRYPAMFPVSLMAKDFSLIMSEAMRLSVPMPATSAAAQILAAERARQTESRTDEDFSAVIRTMQQLAGAIRAGRDA